jgi:general secretion pathway protein I
MRRQVQRQRSRGFSLLEMVVTMAILGLALGALYQAASGATRNVRADQRYAYAVELARSLLADSSVVPLEGVSRRGETGSGFRWELVSTPLARPAGSRLGGGRLQRVEVSVAWPDGTRERRLHLHSVVAGQMLQ